MKPVLVLIYGVIFGSGLLLSGMANPAKVIGFLDIFGQWDSSLIFVMIGAIGVAILPFQFAKRHHKTPTGQPFDLPTNTTIDKKLILGAMIFGIGWGLVGICPAPMFSLIGLGLTGFKLYQVLFFAIPLLVTIWGYDNYLTKQ